jgi:hypothetical protein
MKPVDPLRFFGLLKWLDGRPLPDVIEAYRRRIFTEVLGRMDGDRPRYSLSLCGRAKNVADHEETRFSGRLARPARRSLAVRYSM